jgi:aminocarboxymuconate-semialdehyde decarboxylase
MVKGKSYRTVSEKCWSVPRRLADLPEMGLAHQVISPMPELLSYWLSLEDAQPLIRFLNEYTADMCAQSEGRLIGMAAVPLQDVQVAVDELRYAVNKLGLAAVEVGSNINGVAIGDSRFDPFFEACVALDVPVFVHALKPAGMERLVGPAQLQQVLAYPTDVGLAAASVITGGVFQRFPTLRIAFSHGGGTLAMLLPRLQQGWKVFPTLGQSIAQSPQEQVKKMYFDTLVFDASTLKHLAEKMGTAGLMLGTDYPFNFHEPRPLNRLAEAGFDAATCDDLTFNNARKFLGVGKPEQKETS